MNISIYQLVVLLIALYFLVTRTVKFIKREERQSFLKYAATASIWLSILSLTLFPQNLTNLLDHIGLKADPNTLIFTGFIIVFVLIYKLLTVIEKLERDITELVRDEALKNIKKK